MKLPLRVKAMLAAADAPERDREEAVAGDREIERRARLDQPPWRELLADRRTTVPEPTIWLGFESLIDAITSANIGRALEAVGRDVREVVRDRRHVGLGSLQPAQGSVEGHSRNTPVTERVEPILRTEETGTSNT